MCLCYFRMQYEREYGIIPYTGVMLSLEQFIVEVVARKGMKIECTFQVIDKDGKLYTENDWILPNTYLDVTRMIKFIE